MFFLCIPDLNNFTDLYSNSWIISTAGSSLMLSPLNILFISDNIFCISICILLLLFFSLCSSYPTVHACCWPFLQVSLAYLNIRTKDSKSLSHNYNIYVISGSTSIISYLLIICDFFLILWISHNFYIYSIQCVYQNTRDWSRWHWFPRQRQTPLYQTAGVSCGVSLISQLSWVWALLQF